MPARNVGINSTFEQQRQVINALAVDVDTLITTPVVNAGYASTAGIATYASVAGLATYSSTSGYASTAGIATQALLSSSSNYATVSGVSTYSITAGLSTLSQGLTGSPNISISGMSVSGISTFTSSITLNDSSSISFGDDADLRISHTGSASRIFERGTGNLQITSNGGEISLLKQSSDVDSGEYLARFHTDGGVDLYYDNNKKLEVNNDGVSVTGVLTATSLSSTIIYSSFSGDGSAITGIVTSIVAGTGVTISSSTGAVTINATGGGGGDGYFAQTSAGIHTLSNVGVGTTNPTSALTVQGDGKFTGIVTATRFESTSAGTPTIDSPNNLNINAVNVAISTDLTVGGDAYVGVSTASGLILTSPNGTQYRLIVDNSGTLSTVLVP